MWANSNKPPLGGEGKRKHTHTVRTLKKCPPCINTSGKTPHASLQVTTKTNKTAACGNCSLVPACLQVRKSGRESQVFLRDGTGQHSTFSDDGYGGPLSGMDLPEFALEVAGCEHVHREGGHLMEDDAVLPVPVVVVLRDLLRFSALLRHHCHAAHIILRHVLRKPRTTALAHLFRRDTMDGGHPKPKHTSKGGFYDRTIWLDSVPVLSF